MASSNRCCKGYCEGLIGLNVTALVVGIGFCCISHILQFIRMGPKGYDD